MYNVEKLKLVIGFGIGLFRDLKIKLEDGKLSFPEVIDLLGWLGDLGQIIVNITAIKNAYKNLKPEEKQTLIIYFKDEFDLENDKVEVLIESFFEILLAFSSVFAVIFPTPPIGDVDNSKVSPGS